MSHMRTISHCTQELMTPMWQARLKLSLAGV